MLTDERITQARTLAREAVEKATDRDTDWGVFTAALDLYRDLERAEAAAKHAERYAPSCGDGKVGWCTDTPRGEQPDGLWIGWCQVHDHRAAAEAELERLVLQVEAPAGADRA